MSGFGTCGITPTCHADGAGFSPIVVTFGLLAGSIIIDPA